MIKLKHKNRKFMTRSGNIFFCKLKSPKLSDLQISKYIFLVET